MVLKSLPISDEMLRTFQLVTSKDKVLQKVKDITRNGWADTKAGLPQDVTTFFQFRDEISEANGILMKGEQAIVPSTLRKDMKRRIHEGNLGIEKCKNRARQALFWPGMNTELTEMIQRCSTCQEQRNCQQKEPLTQHTPPTKPWEKVGTELL